MLVASIAVALLATGSPASADGDAPVVGQWVVDSVEEAAALQLAEGGSTEGFNEPCTIEDPTACIGGPPPPEPEPTEPVGPPAPEPAPTDPMGPPAPPVPPGPQEPLELTCLQYTPEYVIFSDDNGNRVFDLGDRPIVRWPFFIQWCINTDDNATFYPVAAYSARALPPLLNPNFRVTQSTTTVDVWQVPTQVNGDVESITTVFSNKNFTLTIGGFDKINDTTLEFNPVIRVTVDGLGRRSACDLQTNECAPMF